MKDLLRTQDLSRDDIYCDAMIVRTFAQSDVDELGAHASIPVINALTDDDHPTQLLADWLTIRENFGSDITGRKFVYLGDGNNMSHAWLIMGAIMGAHVVAATPEGSWSPDSKVIAQAQSIAAKTGGIVEVVHDPEVASRGASVLYTDVWMSMGDPEAERVIWRQAFHRRTTIQAILYHASRGELKGN
jgi:ornithine carbamoyltransferase